MTNIVTALNEGVVSFTYTKADGSTRTARGTTNSDMIPESARATTNRNTDTSAQVSYYDLDKNAWRSFARSNLNESSVKSEAAAG
jgi:WYL_2, Sm-like SH3 beta-barrel fold